MGALSALAVTACTSAVARPARPPAAHPAPSVTPATPAPTAVRALPPPTTGPAPPATPLSAALDALLVNTNSCLLVTDASGRPLYAHQVDAPFTPASTQKLLIAVAALDRLGAGYRFTTTVESARPPVGGVVDALWLVGGGDPLLASPDYAAYLASRPVTAGYPTTPIAAVADQLVIRGVRSVTGGIHGDDTRDEPLRYLPTWGPTINHGEFDVGPLSALEVDQGLDHWRPAIPTNDPAGHAAGVLAALLQARRVVAGQAADGVAPAHPVVLATVESAPLSEVIGAMLRASDNQIAELLVRELDRAAGGTGSTAAGVGLVMADVARLGLPRAGLRLVDGSGLSPGDHVTCRTLLAALDLGDQRRFSAITAGLPVAGVDGTLTYLFRDSPLAGHLAAKGGYIDGVAALVGRVDTGRPRRFALVVNGDFSFTTGLQLEEHVAEAIAGT